MTLSITTLCRYAECHVSRFIYCYAECNYAECCHTECRFAECCFMLNFKAPYKRTQHDDTQYDETQQNDTKHDDIQHNFAQHNRLSSDTQNKLYSA
jgi:hypothetical protein